MEDYKTHSKNRTLILLLGKRCPFCDNTNPPECALCEIRQLDLVERYRKIINFSNDEIQLLVDDHNSCILKELKLNKNDNVDIDHLQF